MEAHPEEDEEGIKPSTSPETFLYLCRECHITYRENRQVYKCEAPAVRTTNQVIGQAFKTSAVTFKLEVQTKWEKDGSKSMEY